MTTTPGMHQDVQTRCILIRSVPGGFITDPPTDCFAIDCPGRALSLGKAAAEGVFQHPDGPEK
jgi:hypothetical protein